jgi:hypothetical protein
MKKAYIYFLVPLLGVIAFGAVYWNFSTNYEKVEADRAAAIQKTKNDKLAEENRNREKAIQEANVAQQKKRDERAAKEAKDRKDREDRENAIQARNKAFNDSDKFKKQAERLAKEITVIKEEIAKIEEDKRRSTDEEAFLKDFVKKVESNAKSLTEVLERIAAADAAAEAAAKAAAAAAAKK